MIATTLFLVMTPGMPEHSCPKQLCLRSTNICQLLQCSVCSLTAGRLDHVKVAYRGRVHEQLCELNLLEPSVGITNLHQMHCKVGKQADSLSTSLQGQQECNKPWARSEAACMNRRSVH